MSNLSNIPKNFIFFLFFLSFKLILCTESLFSYGMKFAKTLKLYGGNIIVAGDIGINTYDNTGTKSLYNYTITQNKIESENDAFYTTLVQFPIKDNGLVIAFVKHIMYILDSDGKHKFNYQPPSLSISSNNQFYTLVPHKHVNNNYYIILAYINYNSKAYLQYYTINVEGEVITLNGDFVFDEDDPDRAPIMYNYGLSCQIMEHSIYGETLTCFYQNNINEKEIAAKNFKIQDGDFVILSELEQSSYKDSVFCIQSLASTDKKKSLVCYVQNDSSSTRKGYCAVYDIEENKFINYNKYLDNQCEANINHITLNYYKETKEYIFSCTYSTANIHITIFDENFDVVKIKSGSQTLTDSTISISNCHYPYFYSIVLLNNAYTILGDFKCDEEKEISILYSIPDEYKPTVIYTDSPEEDDESQESNEESEMSEENASKESNDSTDVPPPNPSTGCSGYKNIEETICLNEIPTGYYIFDFINKIIDECHISCETCNNGPIGISNNCLTCFENFELNEDKNCIYKYNFFFNETINQIIYLLSNEFCPDILPYEIVITRECVKNCETEEFINRKCKINSFSENNIKEITENLRKIINYTNSSDTDVIIDGNNIIYEITTSEVKNDYNNISLIDLGECEKILKQYYKLNYLLIFKTDIKLNDSYPTKVEYEIYSPETKRILNLSLCENTQIDIYAPTSLDNSIYDLYNSANKYGYDIFNGNSSFYNDLCTPFTSQEGTDILLYDRKIVYYNDSIPLCESNCVYQSFNDTNKKAKCQCQVKEEYVPTKKISFEYMNMSSLLDIKIVSNIELIKCFELTFSIEGMTKNYGSIIIIIFIVSYIALIIVHLINQKTSISKILKRMLKMNGFENPPKKSQKRMTIYLEKKSNANDNNEIVDKNSCIDLNTIKKQFKKRKKKKLIFKIKNYQNINVIKNANIYLKDKKKKSLTASQDGITKDHSSIQKIKSHKSSRDIIFDKINNDKNINSHENININLNYNYIEEELNDLEYNAALVLDKRTFTQYYWGLMKKKHMLLSIIISHDDFNVIYVKIGLFIVNFCLYFTMNALFFTDKTMHKIYEDKGLFQLFGQLPHIIYSTLISAVINMIIKRFALADKDVLELKRETKKEIALEKSAVLYRKLLFRFNLYFGISLFLLILFWYYIATFCAVYKNTQIILIENTLLCFGITLIYPFGLNLLPGAFRIPALKAANKDKELLYKIGNIVALLL